MSRSLTLIGLELLVPDIDPAIELFEGVIGLELVERRDSADPAGEIAVFAVGDAAITLIAPRDHGPGTVIDDRSPRLAQIVMALGRDELGPLVGSIEDAGAPVVRLDDHRAVVNPTVVEAATGVHTAITVVEVEPDDDSTT